MTQCPRCGQPLTKVSGGWDCGYCSWGFTDVEVREAERPRPHHWQPYGSGAHTDDVCRVCGILASMSDAEQPCPGQFTEEDM
jgi:uncharacterized Zn finger protein (UPF0148 family)